jgi:protein-S-isoprenylcysteine O-methyltransferase Ste14
MGSKSNLLTFLEDSYIDWILYAVASVLIFFYFWKSSLLSYIGILITLLGFFIWVIGRIELGDSFSILAKGKDIVTTGIYSKIRHPIYLGSFLVDVGLIIYTLKTFLTIFLIIYAITSIIIQCIRISHEEKILF